MESHRSRNSAPDALIIGRNDGSVERHTFGGSAVPGPTQQLRPGVAADSNGAFFAPRTGLIAGTEPDGSVVVRDVDGSRAGRISRPFPGDLRDGAAQPLGFSPDGQTLAIGITTGVETDPGSYVTLWDVNDPAHPRSLAPPLEALDYDPLVAFSPDGRLLASRVGADAPPGVDLFDISDPVRPEPIGDTLAGHTGRIRAIAFSPDGPVLVTAGEDRSIVLWDVADPADPRRLGPPLTGHAAAVNSLAVSPDGHTLASGDVNGNVILWDLTDIAQPRQLGSPLTGHDIRVTALLFSPDGNTLVTSGSLGAVNTWDLTELNALRGNARQVACDRTGRGLDPNEWASYVAGFDYRDTCSG
jgi:WD40 repeat protein